MDAVLPDEHPGTGRRPRSDVKSCEESVSGIHLAWNRSLAIGNHFCTELYPSLILKLLFGFKRSIKKSQILGDRDLRACFKPLLAEHCQEKALLIGTIYFCAPVSDSSAGGDNVYGATGDRQRV